MDDQAPGSAEESEIIDDQTPVEDEIDSGANGAPSITTNPRPNSTTPWADDQYTQVAASAELVRRHGKKFLYHFNRGLYLKYDKIEGRWVPDQNGFVARLVRDVASAAWRHCEMTRGHRQAYSHAKNLSGASGVDAVMRLARSEPSISVTEDALDVDDWMLNTLAGVIDLRTGDITPHSPELRLTKLAPVAYDPAAVCPRWDKFIERVTGGDAEILSYLQRLFGHCLTGDITVQNLWIFWGNGANGKSVFLDTMLGVMGDYAVRAAESLVSLSNGHVGHPTEIADLSGRRLALASETEKGTPLRVQLVKRLTGDTHIKARYMRQDFFERRRTSKTIIVTNNRPRLSETTNAIRRRIKLIPFMVQIPESEQNHNLINDLRSEWPGILGWAVRGCLDWQINGLNAPQRVEIASNEYLDEQDELADWIGAKCVLGADRYATRQELYTSYSVWAGRDSLALKRPDFYEALRKVDGVEDVRRRVGKDVRREFHGIGLDIELTSAGSAGGGNLY